MVTQSGLEWKQLFLTRVVKQLIVINKINQSR